jgi:Flp pilus assembly protein TadG
MALVLPLLIILFSVIVEAGLALNVWNRVNTSARDATRFALDAGRPSDINNLVLYKLRGLNQNDVTIYIVTGTTNNVGTVNSWNCTRSYPTSGSCTNMRLTQATVQTRLQGPNGINRNMSFTAVEVDYNYSPLLTTLFTSGATLPMTSYAIVQQY